MDILVIVELIVFLVFFTNFQGRDRYRTSSFSFFNFNIWNFQLVMPFLYNKQYTSRMLTSGWQLSDEETVNVLARQKLKISES